MPAKRQISSQENPPDQKNTRVEVVLEHLADAAGRGHVENVILCIGFTHTAPSHVHLCEILSPLRRPHCLRLLAACGVPEAGDARAPPTSL